MRVIRHCYPKCEKKNLSVEERGAEQKQLLFRFLSNRKRKEETMKFFHISDLHIGRQLNFYDLSEIQKDLLHQIVEHMRVERPDALLISGDIYDKSVPSGEAHKLLNHFLEELSALTPQIPVLVIAGNHDSPDRLQYANAFLEKANIHIAVYPPREEEEHIKKVTLTDAYGPVHFYLLPFTKPALVRQLFAEGVVSSYDDAVREVLAREKIDFSERNVLLSHQFYVSGSKAPQTCESEVAYLNVGGLDAVDVSAIEKFDYAALGHIHGKQQVGSPHIRYSGTPYKYSVSERNHTKAITVVTLREKGAEPELCEIPFQFKQDVRQEKGTLQEVLERANGEKCQDFVSIVLTDEEPQFKAKEKLEEFYEHILEIRVENTRTKEQIFGEVGEHKQLDPLTSFAEFFRQRQGGKEMSEQQYRIMQEIMEQVKEGEEE